MKLISRNLRNYLVALAVLILCLSLYCAAATQLLRIPDVAEVTPRPPTQDVLSREGLIDLFPDDAWQRGDCKRLLTNRGTLLFKEWQQISEDKWVLEPLTIIIGRGISSEHAKSPIIMNAAEGAEVEFSGALDMMGGSAPPIKMGRMIGDVQIERAGATKRSQSLAVQTRNVRIDMQKVWTTEEITMQVAGADLRGRDLTIYLAASAASATRAETPSTILDRMDLVYLEELKIPLDDPPSETVIPRRIGTQPPSNEATKGNGEVSIRCDNGLVYDFALDRLSLRDSISMIRMLHGKMLDRFDCDTLDLVLRDPSDRSVLRRGPLDWIDRVHATGRPAVMNLASYDFQLDAEEIDFDSIGGLLRAEGRNGIQMRRGQTQATLARLAYQFNPDMPEVIGVIDVRGSGKVNVDAPGIPLRHLSWSKGFNLRPTGQATATAVREKREQSKVQFRVDGDVRARLSDGGNASAGSVYGILRPHYDNKPIEPSADTVASRRIVEPKQRVERTMTLVPEEVHAIGAVSIDSNQLAADTDRMSLFFKRSSDFGKRRPAAKTSDNLLFAAKESQTPAPQNAPGALAGWVNQPESHSELRSPVARPRPRLSGDVVGAKLLITPEGIQPIDVSMEGDVQIDHQLATGDSVLPITMTGQSLRLLRNGVAQATGQDYLQLGSGPAAPAKLKMGDGFFIGPVIKVWPSDNVVKVDGAGELKVPSEVLKKRKKSDPAPPSNQTSPLGISGVDWTSAPYCRWGEAMQFDGKTALLTGGVKIDAELVSGNDPWATTMKGDEMQISLVGAVQLMDRTSMAAAQLAEINLVQSGDRPVIVRAEQHSEQGMREAIHMITASRLVFSPAGGGTFVGLGPGWYRGWVMMDQKNSVLTPRASSSRHLGGQVLQGVHLTFRESMQGDLEKETLAFTGGVRTGVRKLQAWDESVDVAQMQRLAVGEMTMDCQQLRFGISPGMPADLRRIPGMPTPWEMVADGGVVVRSNTEKRGLIEGTATRASYESKKSWLNVEGAPGRSAFVRQTWPDGRKGFQTHSPRMLLNLKSYEFQTIMEDAQINNVTLPK